MNLPFNFNGSMATAICVVLLMLWGAFEAAPLYFSKEECERAQDCKQGEYCRKTQDSWYCDPCKDCQKLNRESIPACDTCGRCLTGFWELGEDCVPEEGNSKDVQKNVTTATNSPTEQTSERDLGTKDDHDKNPSVMLIVFLCLFIVLAIFAYYVYVCKSAAVRATQVPVHSNIGTVSSSERVGSSASSGTVLGLSQLRHRLRYTPNMLSNISNSDRNLQQSSENEWNAWVSRHDLDECC